MLLKLLQNKVYCFKEIWNWKLFKLLPLLPTFLFSITLLAQPQTYYLEEWYSSSGSQDELTDRVVSITDNVNNLYVAGSTLNTYDKHDLLLTKYDSQGNETWSQQFNISNPDGNIIVTGKTGTISGDTYTTVRYAKKTILIPPDTESPAANLFFCENRGQVLKADQSSASDVKFCMTGTSPAMYFMDDTLSLVVSSIDTVASTQDTMHRVDITFGGSKGEERVYALDEKTNYQNYYLGHIQEGRARVRLADQVIHTDAFEYVDIEYTSNPCGPKINFVVHPGGDPDDIEWEFSGQNSLSINSSGDLVVGTALEDIVFPHPEAFQVDAQGNESSVSWTPSFQVVGNEVTINTGTFDANEFLVIRTKNQCNPSNAPGDFWSTYYGGSNYDAVSSLKFNDEENADLFACGVTFSSDFPTTEGVLQSQLAGSRDAFILKFSDDGAQIWATLYGGMYDQGLNLDGRDGALDLDVDSLGNLYVVGRTNSIDFPLFDNGVGYFDGELPMFYSRFSRSFILKLDQETGFSSWATYFGEHLSRNESIMAVAVTPQNHIIVGGYMQPTDPSQGYPNFPNLATGSAHSENEGSNFLAEFDEDNKVIWATLFNTTAVSNLISDIAVDDNNNIFITGTVSTINSGEFITADDNNVGIQTTFSEGNYDAYMAKFNAQRDMVWSTFFGGTNDDVGSAITLDGNGNIFVTGNTSSNSSSFPLLDNIQGSSYYDNSLGGSQDLFIAQFDNNRDQKWTSYFGGSGIEEQFTIDYVDWDFGGSSIATDAFDNLYITALSNSTNLDVNTLTMVPASYYYDEINRGGGSNNSDAFLLVVNPGLNKSYCTYWGGYNDDVLAPLGDRPLCLDVDGYESVAFGGNSLSTDPTIPVERIAAESYLQESRAGGADGFITKLFIDPFVNGNPVGLEEQRFADGGLVIFPNPGTNEVSILIPNTLIQGDKRATTKIYNALGQLIIERNMEEIPSNKLLKIDINDISIGTYFINISIGNAHFIDSFIKH